MSYLPSSRLYEREPEATPAPVPAPQAKRTVAAPAEPVAAKPKLPPNPIPVQAISAPPPAALPPAVTPAPAPSFAPPPGPKEWLVAPPPLLRETAAPSPREETVTVPVEKSQLESDERVPHRKRNLFRNAQKVVLRHLDKAKSRKSVSEDPDLLWFVVMATGSLCMGLMIWGAYSALPRFGNNHIPLRAGGPTSTLKVSSDVPVRWVRESGSVQPHHPPVVPPLVPPVAMPPVADHVIPHHPPVVPVSVPPPPHEQPRFETKLPEPEHRPAPVEPPLNPLPERKEPSVFVHANLGETPMIRTWKKLAETSFLLAAFTAVPANNLLGQIPDKVQVDYSKQINELTKAVQDLSGQVNAMKFDDKLNAVKNDLNDKISKIKLDAPRDNNDFLLVGNRLDRLEKLINQMIQNPIAAAPNPVAPAPFANANLDDIKSKLGNIEQAILKLQGPEKRIALSPPGAEPAVVNKPSTSHVIFVNLYNQDLWLFINQKQHRVPANTTLTLDSIPAGPAAIEVRSPDGVFHKSNPTLVASETFTLTAR